MNKRRLLALILFILFLAGCSAPAAHQEAAVAPSAPRDSTSNAYGSGGTTGSAPQQPGKAAGPADSNQPATTGGSGTDAGIQLVIKNATLTIVVPDPTASMQMISAMANTMGGFVVSSNLYKTSTSDGIEIPEANIVIRVPADKLDSALDQIHGQVKDPAKDIRNEQITGQDVTKEYTDLNSRLTNLQAKAEDLKNIMDRATKTEDILSVYQMLSQTQEEIEVIKGQMKYYEDSARLSMISVQLIAQQSVKPLTVAGWEPVGVAADALQALINALKGIIELLIWLILFMLPVLVIFLVPAWLIWRVVRRYRANHKSKVTPTYPYMNYPQQPYPPSPEPPAPSGDVRKD